MASAGPDGGWGPVGMVADARRPLDAPHGRAAGCITEPRSMAAKETPIRGGEVGIDEGTDGLTARKGG